MIGDIIENEYSITVDVLYENQIFQHGRRNVFNVKYKWLFRNFDEIADRVSIAKHKMHEN